MRAFLDNHDHFEVYLDKLYKERVRPDVAVELNGHRLVAVEVKTDLGWQRDYIASGKWSKRRKACINIGFGDAYLLILANSNWSGFKPDMESQNVRVLMCTSPNDPKFKWYTEPETSLDRVSSPEFCTQGDVIHPIEELFTEIAHVSGLV